MNKKEFESQSKAYSKIKELSKELNVSEYTIYQFVNNENSDVFIKQTQDRSIPLRDIRKKILQITEYK
jgi:hypothetical protein